jgi:hypothetical protein
LNASGGNTANYVNPNQFALGANQPGIELTGIKRTDVTGGYFRYSLTGITTNLAGNNGACPGPSGGTTFTGGPTAGATSGTPTCTGSGGRGFDFYGHVTQSFDGYGIVSGQRVGAFFMYGKAPTVDNPISAGSPGTVGNGKDFTRVGGDLSLTYAGQWNLFGAYMYANDSAGLFANTQTPPSTGTFQNASWHGGFAQLDWYPTQLPVLGPGWLFSYRYDRIQNIRQGISNFAHNYNNVDSNTFLARYYVHQSARTEFVLHAEGNFYTDKGVGLDGTALNGKSVLVGFDWAF